MRPVPPLALIVFLGACKSSPTTPATPPTVAVVNRSGLAYTLGVAVFTNPSRADTLAHSTGSDSVCVQMPAAGDALEAFFGIPVDTLDPHQVTQVFQGSSATGWLLFYGKVGTDTVITFTASPTSPC